MDFDISFIITPINAVSAALRTVYILHADSSYDVKKTGIPKSDLVALHTIGGLGKIIIKGCEEITLDPGSLIFFEHDKVQRYYCASEAWDFWWFEFSTQSVLSFILNIPFKMDPAAGELDTCRTCLSLLKKQDPGSYALASANFSLLLNKWLMNIKAENKTHPYKQAVEKSIECARASLENGISVKLMAESAGFSERRFRQIFKAITGSSPKLYMDELRINLAEELLKNTSFTIYDISLRLGYSSQFHFCREFKKKKGKAPTAFRLSM